MIRRLRGKGYVLDINRLLKVAVRGGASDVHLKVGKRPVFRFNGGLTPLNDGSIISTEIMSQWINQIVPSHLLETFGKTGDIDFSYVAAKGQRFRVNAFRQRGSYGVVMRVISGHVLSIEELQLPLITKDISRLKRGLVLVTGATGSGKSTSLAAMIQKINETEQRHIMTIEDPIEFTFEDKQSTINQREVGTDTQSFSVALRAALRQDPDVIFVGELRDKETTETALMAAETGHLVFSTMHTLDAVESLTRLMSFFDPHQQASIKLMLAQTLRGVLSQRLVRRADNMGMVAAVEVLIVNERVRSIISEGGSFDLIQAAIRDSKESYGMQSFDQALIQLYESGIISRNESLSHATNRDDMKLRLSGIAG